MQMRHLPMSAEEEEERARVAPPDPTPPSPTALGIRPPRRIDPHSIGEERWAYVSAITILGSIVVACVGLSEPQWKEEKFGGRGGGGPEESFGLRHARISGESFRLESLGCVWPVYTSARCALAFTIIGVLFGSFTLLRHVSFIRHSRGTSKSLMLLNLLTSTWFLWAIMLYALLFPRQPFKGDLAYLAPEGAGNFTNMAAATAAVAQGRVGERIQSRHTPQWQWITPEQPLESPSPLTTSHAPTSPRFLRPLPRSLANDSDTVLPLPDSDPTPPAPNPYDAPPSAEEIAKREFQALVYFEHLGSEWKLSRGYWMVMAAALGCLLCPFLVTIGLILLWLYDRHRSAVVENPRAVPVVLLLVGAWLVGIVGFASEHWMISSSSGPGFHFGLDRFVVEGRRRTVGHTRFESQGQTIATVSAVALTCGVVGIVVGFLTCVAAGSHVYDKGRDRHAVIALSGVTWILWMTALLVYGLGFPRYPFPYSQPQGMYFELGWSFWLVLAGCCVFFLPLLLASCIALAKRARRTTKEERILFIPTALAILAVGCSLGALGSDAWAERGGAGLGVRADDHLGLLRGRLQGEWLGLQSLVHATSIDTARAGISSLVLALCAMLLQLPVALMGLQHVRGEHASCGGEKQMPLLATALSLAVTLIHTLAVIAYAVLLPWDTLPDGYALSHSWRVQVAALALTAASTVGFALLAQPPEPGEINVLTAAIPVGKG